MKDTFKLELKKDQGDDKIFYRYRYETCVIWFEQDQTTGSIYRVDIKDEEFPDVEYYSDDTKDRFYPTRVRMIFYGHTVTDDSDFEKIARKISLCGLRRSSIEKFILSSDNYKLWLEKHGESK